MVFLAAGAALTLLGLHWHEAPSPAFWFWLTVCLLGEIIWVRLPLGGATTSAASAANLSAILLLPIGEAMGVALFSVVLVERWVVRKSWSRAIYNASQTAITVGAASFAFSLLGGQTGSPFSILLGTGVMACVAAAAVYYVCNSGFTTLAVSIDLEITALYAWKRNFFNWRDPVVSVFLFAIGLLLAALFELAGPIMVACVLTPLLVAERIRGIPYGEDEATLPQMVEFERFAAKVRALSL